MSIPPNRVGARDAHQRLTTMWPVITLTVLAFALRLYRLGTVEFWFDEASTYLVAIKDYPDILTYVRQAFAEHPPFYFMSLHVWMQWAGVSEFAIRFYSLMLGTLFVPLLYRFARREFGAEIGLSATLAAAASPFIFIYSQEARMYTLLPVLGLLAMDFFLQVVHAGRRRDWALFVLVSLIGVATHYYFVLTFPGQLLFFLVFWRALPRKVLVGWCALMVALALALLGWLVASPGFMTTLLASAGDRYIPPFYVRLERVLRDVIVYKPFGFDLDIPVRLLAILCWVPLFFGLRYRPTDTTDDDRWRRGRVLLLTTTLGALLGIIILPQGVVGRQAGVMLPAFLTLLVMGVAELARRGRLRGAFALVYLLLAFTFGIYQHMLVDKGDWGEALAQLARDAQPGDAIVLTRPTAWPAMLYYQRRGDLRVYFAPDHPDGLSAEEAAQFMQQVQAIHPRIWIGETGVDTSDPFRWTAQWLAAHDFALRVNYHRSVSFYLFTAGELGTVHTFPAAKFGEHIRLDSALLNTEQVKPGQTLLLNLQWQTDARLPTDDLVMLKLVDESGSVQAEQRLLPCGGHCLTTDWTPNSLVNDRHALIVPVGTPPGEYRLMLELYDPARHGVLPTRGNASALELARVQVVPDPQAVAPRVAQPLAVRFGAGLRLMGIDGAPSVARAGDWWPVDVVWGADGPVPNNAVAVFRWLNARDEVVSEMPLPIGTDTYPAFLWQPGEIIRQHYDVPLPKTPLPELQVALQVRDVNTAQILLPSLPNSDAPLAATWPLVKAATATDSATTWTVSNQPHAKLATVQVRQIERRFVAPEVVNALDVHFADQFALIGYEFAQPARGKLDVTLHWRALAPPPTNYKVFVHVLRDDDLVLAQHDSQPANDLRPTSSWVFGEFVTDEHRLALNGVPSGTYRVEVGLYDPTNGERLPVFVQHVPQPDNRILLKSVHVP